MMETREEWLNTAVTVLTPLIERATGQTVPPVRVSVGWPGGRSAKADTIGQCWSTHATGDGVAQLFIAPSLDSPAIVLATLAHELVHAVDDNASGHRGAFRKMAKAIGLQQPWTATTAGPALRRQIDTLLLVLGGYPHARLNRSVSAPKKQGTRMLKIVCPDCGYTARTTAKWLEVGLPTCPCGQEMIDYEPTPEGLLF